MRITVIILISLLGSLNISSQSIESRNRMIDSIIALKFRNLDNELSFIVDTDERLIFSALVQIEKNTGQNKIEDSSRLKKIKNITPSNRLYGWWKLTESTFHYYYSRNTSYPIELNNEAYDFSKTMKDRKLQKLSLRLFLKIFSRENTLDKNTFENFKKEYVSLVETKSDSAWLLYYTNFFDGMSASSPLRIEKSAQDLYNFTVENNTSLSKNLEIHLYQNIALNFRFSKKNDSAKKYLKRIIEAADQPFFNKIKFNSYLELGRIETSNNNLNISAKYFDKAKEYYDKTDSLNSVVLYDRYKAMNFYEPQKKYDSAYHLFKISRFNEAKLDYEKNNTVVSELNIRLRTAQKEKENLVLTAQKKRNQNIAIGLGGSLVLLTIIGSLIYRNTKRKQRIAEQEKELQIQKTTTILKEQEINTINAMVEGQEKERLRLARDLHDNLGGTLAAVKMHIGNLQNNLHKSKNPQELLEKANVLISEAYKNVRSIAHERNSGVMAKEGLLPAIQKLAHKSSSSGGLSIDVQDFGLEERLSNHLEITIFRIVQELVTNVIKHAAATEVIISLTQHEKELNIVVEDNGKGFAVGKLEEKDGMGLGSIERRIEYLEGTMLVDSTLGNGTHIIIDIPV